MITLTCSNYDHFACSFGEVEQFPNEAALYVTALEDTSYSFCQIISALDTHFFSFHSGSHLGRTIDMDNDNIRNDSATKKKIISLFKRHKKMKYIESFGNGVMGGIAHEFLILSARIPALVNYYLQQELAFGYHSFATSLMTYEHLFNIGQIEQENVLVDFLTMNGEQPLIAIGLSTWLQNICFNPQSPKLQVLGFKVASRYRWTVCYDMTISAMHPYFAKKHSPQVLEAITAYRESMETYYPFIKDDLQ